MHLFIVYKFVVVLVSPIYFMLFAGQFYAHIHKDDFRLQFGNETAPDGLASKSFALFVPSLSPIYNNNPGFRVVSLDTESKTLVDYKQYYMDLVMATGIEGLVLLIDGLQSISRESNGKDVAAMLVELTIEANGESFNVVLQHGGNDVTCKRSILCDS